MNITQKEIDELVLFASKIMQGKGEALPEDVVQDAIIISIETGNSDLKKIVKSIAFDTKQERTNDKPNSFSEYDTNRTCKICNENMPIAMFPIFTYKSGKKKKIMSSYCVDCNNKKGRENYCKRKGITGPPKEYISHESEKARIAYHKERRKNDEAYKKAESERHKRRYHYKKYNPEFLALLKKAHSVLRQTA